MAEQACEAQHLDAREACVPRKVSTPAHAKQLGWCVEFESRVAHTYQPELPMAVPSDVQSSEGRDRLDLKDRKQRHGF